MKTFHCLGVGTVLALALAGLMGGTKATTNSTSASYKKPGPATLLLKAVDIEVPEPPGGIPFVPKEGPFAEEYRAKIYLLGLEGPSDPIRGAGAPGAE